MIYNQHSIPKNKWRYGFRSSAAVGCGWIATYNALRLLGRRETPEKLIDYYERQLPLLNGNFGTQFWGPYAYFKKQGFEPKLVLNPEKYDEMAEEVNILFYHWRKGLKLGAHFICLKKTDTGYIGYNAYRNSTGPDRIGTSLEDFIQKKKHFLTALITIRPGS